MNEMSQTDRLLFEKFQVAAKQVIPDSMLLHTTNIETFYDAAMRSTILHMSGYVFGHRLDEQVVEYPATWWQHVKQRWFPVWLKRRSPVRMETKRMTLWSLHPWLKHVAHDPVLRAYVYHVQVES